MKKEIFDIETLRANTGLDSLTEQKLLEAFCESVAELIEMMRHAIGPCKEYEDLWRTNMHQIKGAALNVVATRLMRLADYAQEQCHAPLDRKQTMLAAVQDEFEQVQAAIQSHIYGKRAENQRSNPFEQPRF